MLFMFFINDMEKTLAFSITSLSNCSPLLAGNSTAGLSIQDHTCTLHKDYPGSLAILNWLLPIVHKSLLHLTPTCVHEGLQASNAVGESSIGKERIILSYPVTNNKLCYPSQFHGCSVQLWVLSNRWLLGSRKDSPPALLSFTELQYDFLIFTQLLSCKYRHFVHTDKHTEEACVRELKNKRKMRWHFIYFVPLCPLPVQGCMKNDSQAALWSEMLPKVKLKKIQLQKHMNINSMPEYQLSFSPKIWGHLPHLTYPWLSNT